MATAARRCTSTALALRFCRGGAALAAAAAKASRLTSLSLMGCGLALDELAPLEGRLPHLTSVDLSANLLGRRPPSAQARSAGARALEDLAFRCDAVDMAQVCVEPQSRAYPFDGGDAVAGALARGLRKRNAPPSRIMIQDNAFTAGAWREVLSALALRPPSDTLDVSRPGVLGSASEATWARDLAGAVRSASTIILDDADALALHAGRPAARGTIEMLSVTGRTAATELATVLASFAVEAEIERVAPHAILTALERSDVLKHLSARGCRLDARRGRGAALRAGARVARRGRQRRGCRRYDRPRRLPQEPAPAARRLVGERLRTLSSARAWGRCSAVSTQAARRLC